MNKITVILAYFAICNVTFASVPTDTLVAWFGNNCYRPNQVKAFETIIEYNAGSMFNVMRKIIVKPEYDTPTIKSAFEGFVRSITVDYDTSSCSPYLTDSALWDYQFTSTNEPDGWPGRGAQILSLYFNWGLTTDLYPIAVKLSYNQDARYNAFVWNELGTGLFEYIKGEIGIVPNDHSGLAYSYLANFKNPSASMVSICVEVIQALAILSDMQAKYIAAEMMVRLYVKGFDQFRNDIIQLQNDPELKVRDAISRRIVRQQKYGKMLDFQVPAP